MVEVQKSVFYRGMLGELATLAIALLFLAIMVIFLNIT
jgi:hypothetical protein